MSALRETGCETKCQWERGLVAWDDKRVWGRGARGGG